MVAVHSAAKTPSIPITPAAAAGISVGIAKALLELEEPMPPGVDAGVEVVDYIYLARP